MARTAQEVYKLIEREVIVAGTRGMFPPDVAIRVCGALLEEGIKIFVLAGVNQACHRLRADSHMLIGRKIFGQRFKVAQFTAPGLEPGRFLIRVVRTFERSQDFIL